MRDYKVLRGGRLHSMFVETIYGFLLYEFIEIGFTIQPRLSISSFNVQNVNGL